MNKLEQENFLEQTEVKIQKIKAEEKVERSISFFSPLIKAAVLTIAILFLFKLL